MMTLLALAIGSFGIGMTEFVMMGILPQIAEATLPALWAQSQEQAIAQAGWLISLYALGVVVGAPTISGFAARFPRHRVLIVLASALTVFNALAIIAPTFELVGVARFLAGLPHGAYFGMAALVAADIMGPARRAQGVAFVMTGLTVANIFGVPLGTWLGQTVGWQAAFVVVALIFATATVLIWIYVPHHPGDPGRTMRAELRVFRIGQVWATLGIGAVGLGGFFAVYSYVAPMVTEVAGQPHAVVPLVLVVMGVGMTVGNLLGGRLADRNLSATILGALLALVLSLVLLSLTAGWIVSLTVSIFLVGVTTSVASPALQTRLMDVAQDNQSIAAALHHSIMNVGNSLGAALGGLVIAAGLGYTAPAWVGCLLAIVGLVVAACAVAAASRSQVRLAA